MRRYLALLLAVLTVSLTLCGCGEGEIPSLKRASGHTCDWIEKRISGKPLEDVVREWGIYDMRKDAYFWKVERKEKEPIYIRVAVDTDMECTTVDVIAESKLESYYDPFLWNPYLMGKPVIYLYPEQETEVTVEVDIGKEFISVYPAYDNGWKMIASPDGTLTDPTTGREYYCLFWEGMADHGFDMSKGFCVKGTDTAAFLEDALGKLGLTDKEANEFIIYWLPQMEKNPYNLISFQKEAYTEQAKLTVTPTPDTMIRVFMAWQGSEEAVEIAPQELSAPKREGFTVVEWGAGEIGK